MPSGGELARPPVYGGLAGPEALARYIAASSGTGVAPRPFTRTDMLQALAGGK